MRRLRFCEFDGCGDRRMGGRLENQALGGAEPQQRSRVRCQRRERLVEQRCQCRIDLA
jgi:hypothetical protein